MITYIVITICLCTISGAGSLVIIYREHLIDRAFNNYQRLLKAKYIYSISRIIVSTDHEEVRLPRCSSKFAHRIVIDILAKLPENCYGYSHKAVQEVISKYNIESRLAFKLKTQRGKHRAITITTASKLPVSREFSYKLSSCIAHRNRYVSFCSLCHATKHHPEKIYKLIELHPHTLSSHELRHIAHIITNNYLDDPTVASLLRSSNINHQHLGIKLIHTYNRPHLFKELHKPQDRSIVISALHSAIHLHHDICSQPIIDAISTLPTHARRSIYRLCIIEGYSMLSLNSITAKEQDISIKNIITNSITSHKRSISNIN